MSNLLVSIQNSPNKFTNQVHFHDMTSFPRHILLIVDHDIVTMWLWLQNQAWTMQQTGSNSENFEEKKWNMPENARDIIGHDTLKHAKESLSGHYKSSILLGILKVFLPDAFGCIYNFFGPQTHQDSSQMIFQEPLLHCKLAMLHFHCVALVPTMMKSHTRFPKCAPGSSGNWFCDVVE